MPLYHVNEFIVDSEIVFPAHTVADDALLLNSARASAPGGVVTIRRGSLAHVPSLLRKLRRQLAYDVGDGFLIEPKTDLALHVDLRGENIIVDCADARLSTAAAWCFHAGLGAATLLRGGLPLHGAGLEIQDQYIALCAPSGAGKSTLSWFLLEQGARFANDDLVPAYIEDGGDGTGEVRAFPSVTLMPKLQRETVDHYNLSMSDLLPADYGTNEEEYHIPLPAARRRADPGRLSAVFALRPNLSGDSESELQTSEVIVRRLNHEEASGFVSANLHAEWIIGRYLDRKKLHDCCARVARHVPVYELSYHRSLDILPVLRRTIEETMQVQGKEG